MLVPCLPVPRSVTLRAVLLGVATLLTVAACESITAPNCPLDSGWMWEWNNNPSGSSLSLYLSTDGQTVSGIGVRYGVGPTATADPIIVSGRYTPRFGSVELTLSHRSGRVTNYTGMLICPNKLQGTATDGGSPYPLVLYRGGAL
jgi:hypothetical protein